jgi:hypothetical protein
MIPPSPPPLDCVTENAERGMFTKCLGPSLVGPAPGSTGDKVFKELNELVNLERDAGRKENTDR